MIQARSIAASPTDRNVFKKPFSQIFSHLPHGVIFFGGRFELHFSLSFSPLSLHLSLSSPDSYLSYFHLFSVWVKQQSWRIMKALFKEDSRHIRHKSPNTPSFSSRWETKHLFFFSRWWDVSLRKTGTTVIPPQNIPFSFSFVLWEVTCLVRDKTGLLYKQ